jgi:hypothetical protein
VVQGGVFWTAPVLVDGRIYFRGSQGDLVCLDHRTAPSAVASAAAPSQADLPAAAEVLQRYHAATKLGERELPSVRWSGKLNNDSLGLVNVDATWEVAPEGKWRSEIELPWGSSKVVRAFDGDLGWELNPFMGDNILKPEELDEARRTGGFRFLFTPFSQADATTAAREPFRGIDCHRVDVKVAPEIVRHVYFAADTGLLLGRTCDAESTVVFADWREADGVKLPYGRTEFAAESGEEFRWRFEEVTFEAADPELFVLPEKLREQPEADEEPEDEGDG